MTNEWKSKSNIIVKIFSPSSTGVLNASDPLIFPMRIMHIIRILPDPGKKLLCCL